MVLDLHCISFIVYHSLSGILVIYFILNIIISIITITCIIVINIITIIFIFFYTYVTLLGAISLTLCVFGGIHISDLTLSFYLFLL